MNLIFLNDGAVISTVLSVRNLEFAVQFMRNFNGEKTTLKREDVLEQVRWDDEFQPQDHVRNIGLKLAYVTRTSFLHDDVESRMFEMRSPSSRYVITFRCLYFNRKARLVSV